MVHNEYTATPERGIRARTLCRVRSWWLLLDTLAWDGLNVDSIGTFPVILETHRSFSFKT